MTQVTVHPPPPPTYSVSDSGTPAAITSMSPDALLSYCQIQLGSIDKELTAQMDAQKLALRQRSAAQEVQTKLESFGTKGPSTEGQLKACTDAFDAAIAKLDPGDPIAAQLTAQHDKLISDYGNSPKDIGPLSWLLNIPGNSNYNPNLPAAPPPPKYDPNRSLIHGPADEQWKGTVGGVDNLVGSIKSDAEIKMLLLQDLVSQRQQVVAQATGMMSKENQTLDDGAKAIGQ